MDKSGLVNIILQIIPALWVVAGPALTVMVTGFFNTVVKAYLPREIQIPLAGLLSAVLASLNGGDPVMAATLGSATQTALSLNPSTFLAGKRS